MYNKAFMELDKKLSMMWSEGKVMEAIELLEKSIDQYPENAASMNLDLAFFYLGTDNEERCIEILYKALEKGMWYPKEYFAKHKDKEPFIKMFEQWDKISESDIKSCKPYWKVITPSDYMSSKKYPLFVAIHGWGEDVDMFEAFWHSNRLSEQYILALPQSSQIIGTSKYSWNDNKQSHKELQEMYRYLLSNYSVDTDKIIVGGFSQGATLAIDLTINHTYMPSKGFIALNPDKPDDFLEESLIAAKDKRGYIITGDKDQSYQQQKDMMNAFKVTGFTCQMDVIAGWGHWFPEDLSERIDRAIEYIKA